MSSKGLSEQLTALANGQPVEDNTWKHPLKTGSSTRMRLMRYVPACAVQVLVPAFEAVRWYAYADESRLRQGVRNVGVFAQTRIHGLAY